MTFKEKLAKEYPERVHDRYVGGCMLCPNSYGYEPKSHIMCPADPERCKKCWNREMPGTEPIEESKVSTDKKQGMTVDITFYMKSGNVHTIEDLGVIQNNAIDLVKFVFEKGIWCVTNLVDGTVTAAIATDKIEKMDIKEKKK